MSWPGRPVSVSAFAELCSSLSGAVDGYAGLFARGARELTPPAMPRPAGSSAAPVDPKQNGPGSASGTGKQPAEVRNAAGGELGAGEGVQGENDRGRGGEEAGRDPERDAGTGAGQQGGPAEAGGDADGANSASPAANEAGGSRATEGAESGGGAQGGNASGKKRKAVEEVVATGLESRAIGSGSAGAR